jgi:hypothetical protein
MAAKRPNRMPLRPRYTRKQRQFPLNLKVRSDPEIAGPLPKLFITSAIVSLVFTAEVLLMDHEVIVFKSGIECKFFISGPVEEVSLSCCAKTVLLEGAVAF